MFIVTRLVTALVAWLCLSTVAFGQLGSPMLPNTPPVIGQLPSAVPALTAQAYTTNAGDLQHLLQVSTGYGHSTITLMSAVTAGNGATICVQKADNVQQSITGTANNGSGLIRVAVPDTSKYASGQQYQITGTLGTIEANGAWRVTVVDATHIDLVGSTFTNAYTSGGTIGNNRVTVQSTEGGVVDRAWLTAGPSSGPPWPGDNACFQSNGSTWQVLGKPEIMPLKWWWSASDAVGWVRPPLMTELELRAVGGGAGGGSGRRGATGAIRTGGSGGQGGFKVYDRFRATDFATAVGATEQVTVGAGGNGGAAQTVDTTNGIVGVGGTSSTFGTNGPNAGFFINARSGGAGNAGSTANAAGVSTTNSTLSNWYWQAGSPSSSSTGTCVPVNAGSPGAGGSGGSADAANTQRLPCAGSAPNTVDISSATIPGGIAGTAGNPGGAGGTNMGTPNFGGSGGGGGFYASATAGTAGGVGGRPGGGGGGGAASDNGFNSGAGGNGAPGEVQATAIF